MNDFMNWIEETFESTYEGASINKPEEKTKKQTERIVKEEKLTDSEVRKCFYRRETGAVEMVSYFIGEDFIFNLEEKTWYKRNSYYWQACDTSQPLVDILTDSVVPEYLQLADKETDSKTADSIRNYARGFYDIARRNRVIEGLQTKLGKRVEWSKMENQLPLLNGLVDLSTGDIVTPKESEFIRDIVPVEYKGLKYRSSRPKIDDVVYQQCDEDYDTYRALWYALGSSIKGIGKMKKFFILWGKHGDNGKSMLFRILNNVFSSNLVASIDKELILVSNSGRGTGPKEVLMDLQGKRIVYFEELNEGNNLDGAMVKTLTGGDVIRSHRKFKSIEDFFPTHTPFMYTNMLPNLNVYDTALLKRIVVIPFDVSFVDNPQQPWERAKDGELEEKLLQDKSSIVSWLVEGSVRYEKEGLCISQRIADATREYFSNQDSFRQIMTTILTAETVGKKYFARELYERYKELEQSPMSMKAFTQRITALKNEGILNEAGLYNGTMRYEVIRPLELDDAYSDIPLFRDIADVTKEIEIPF